MVACSQPAVGPLSTRLLVSTRKAAVCGRGGGCLCWRSLVSSSWCWKAQYRLTRHPLQFFASSSFIVPHCGHSVMIYSSSIVLNDNIKRQSTFFLTHLSLIPPGLFCCDLCPHA